MAKRVEGIDQVEALFDRLPAAAKEELGALLAEVGQAGLAAEKRDVPRKTGALAGALRLDVVLDRLRVRIGLIGLDAKGGRKDLFYGRIVNFGRAAQTVPYSRRRAGAAKTLRNRRKRLEDIVATGVVRVRAMAPRPFVTGNRDEVSTIADGKLADFWSRVFAKTGSGA